MALQGTGPELAARLAANQWLVNVDHIFNPTVTKEDQQELALTAKVAGAMRQGTLDSEKLSNYLHHGKWSRALQLAEQAAPAMGAPAEDVLGLAMGLLFIPASVVDAFTVSAVHGAGVSAMSNSRRLLTSAHDGSLDALGKFLPQNHTREGLVRAVGFGATLKNRVSESFDAGFSHPLETRRLARLEKALDSFAKNPAGLTAVLTLVGKHDWKGADQEAQKHLAAAGITGGNSVDDPPALADVLLLSVIPTCDTLIFARHLKQGGGTP
ncbi:MAG: hypothetical protein ACXU86_15185 [Archangium sp.]